MLTFKTAAEPLIWCQIDMTHTEIPPSRDADPMNHDFITISSIDPRSAVMALLTAVKRPQMKCRLVTFIMQDVKKDWRRPSPQANKLNVHVSAAKGRSHHHLGRKQCLILFVCYRVSDASHHPSPQSDWVQQSGVFCLSAAIKQSQTIIPRG